MHQLKVCSGIFFVVLLSMLLVCTQSMAFNWTKEGKKLYKQWTDILGYSSSELVDKMDPAPQIKPGAVITPQNYKDYPGLKKLLPETIYMRLNPDFFLPLKKIEVTETRPRYFPQGVINGTRLCMKTCKIDKDTWKLEGYKYGLPFPHPKTPIQLIWDEIIASRNFNQNMVFDPITFLNFNRNRELDSKIKAILDMIKIKGRYKIPGRDLMEFNEDHVAKYFEGRGLLSIGRLVITYPADSKGMAFLRYRYFDPEKKDRFVSFLPGLRRIRVLSGSDAQDPILGSELVWDTWTAEWQKQPTKDPDLFPNEYKILGKRVILQPIYPQHPSLRIEGEQMYSKWEKRPVWVLQIKSKDPTYYCSKRILYIDMECFKTLYEEYYDREGNLLRTWEDFKYMEPNGLATWEGCDIPNYKTKRHTILKMNSTPCPPQNPSNYSMKWLNRMAR